MSEMRYVRLPADVAERYRIAGEKERLRLAKLESNRERKHSGHVPLAEREFTVWDGEGPRDTGYSLLGNSDGDELCYRSLRTKDCLNFLLEAARKRPERIHVIFGGNYDMSCILGDLSWRHFRSLKDNTKVLWRDYEIEHVPRKWFRVKRGHVSVTVYDIHSFFSSSLVAALEKWKVGPWSDAGGQNASLTTRSTPDHLASGMKIAPSTSDRITGIKSVPPMQDIRQMSERQLVETFKRLRGDFLWKDMPQITVYMRLELKYTKILCERLREQFVNAGYLPRSWHGPGALARMAFKRHDVYKALTECPPDVQIASWYAFIGGRFETVRAGRVNGRVYCADLNSAYAYYCAMLPNLAKGKWVYAREYEPSHFSVWRIRFTARPEAYAVYPLAYRGRDGGVSWPHRTESWYWSPEAAMVANDDRADIVEGWVFREDEPNDRPFAWIAEYYRRRRILKDLGNPAENTFKMILASVYGQLAQRAGWDKKTGKPPRSHQLEFAGWITSGCRAAVYQAALLTGESLLSLDTDGVMASQPFTGLTGIGKELGQWELKTYDDGLFWQNGIYALQDDGEWENAKTRGIPKGSYTVDDLMECMRTGNPLKMTRNVFTGYGLALNGRHDQLNKWSQEPREYEFGGGGKRYHPVRGGKCCCGTDTELHKLALPSMLNGPFTNPQSYPHELPWHAPRSKEKQEMDDMMLFDQDHLDYDEEWVRDYASR